ncbi:hypothetical protein vseg_011678 [Gypsophila vaccaria]
MFIPDKYILSRWTKGTMKRTIYDLDENEVEDYRTMDLQKELSKLWLDIHATVGVLATKNFDNITKVISVLKEYNEKLEPTLVRPNNKQKEIEMLFGCSTPIEVTIHPPKKASNKGSGSGSSQRLVSSKAKAIQKAAKPKRMCKNCSILSHHDSRNCPYTVQKAEVQEKQIIMKIKVRHLWWTK